MYKPQSHESRLKTEELIKQYEETYNPKFPNVPIPSDSLLDKKLKEKVKSITDKMQPKDKGGLDCDWWTVIVGGEGTGKSTLATALLLEYSKLNNLNFINNLTRFTAFDEFDMLRIIANLNETETNRFIFADEGANVFFNRESGSKLRRFNIKFSNAMRFLRYFVVICSVELNQLDTIIRNHRVKTLIHIERQGVYHFYNHDRLIKLLQKNQYRRGHQFNWYAVEPDIVGTYKNNPQVKAIVDKLKTNYLIRFRMEASKEYQRELNRRLKDFSQYQSHPNPSRQTQLY